jgi:hypothetical protein
MQRVWGMGFTSYIALLVASEKLLQKPYTKLKQVFASVRQHSKVTDERFHICIL